MTLSGFLLTQGGGSHRRDVGRILFWKRTRPTPRKKSTRAFRLRPGPPTTQRPGASAPAFGNQPPEAGAAARKHRHGNTIPNPDGPPIVPFPRKRPLYPPLAALSPLSPIPPRGTKGRDRSPSPLETPLRARRGSGSGKRSMGCPICSPLCSAPTGAGDAVLGGTGIAQPAGDFRILSAVRDGQPPLWVS